MRKRCPNCGRLLSLNWDVCPYCGLQQSSEKSENGQSESTESEQ
ncbi:MAG: zinc ribbon domain-containing protein [Anaerolineae bacterium]